MAALFNILKKEFYIALCTRNNVVLLDKLDWN